MSGVAGEMAILSELVVMGAGFPLSILFFPIADALHDAGYPIGSFALQWATIVALGAIQWFVLLPLIRNFVLGLLARWARLALRRSRRPKAVSGVARHR